MSVVGIGNLIVDYYFFDNQIYINSGGTISNILINLSKMKINTKIVGYYGTDALGDFAKTVLENSGVNTDYLEKKNYKTKAFFINSQKTTSVCPYCNKKRSNYKLNFDINKFINEDDIILIKDYYYLNDNFKNKICLDFGYYDKLKFESEINIYKFITRKYFIVNIKEDVLIFLLNKLNITFEEFKNIINIDFLVITKGKKGATIIFNNKIYNFTPIPLSEKDTNGCGDVFFATFISEIIKRKNISEKDIFEIYNLAQKNVKIVINNIGAINHIIPNKIIIKKDKCICENF